MQGGANVSDPIKRYVFLRMKLNAMRYLIPAVPVTLVFLITALRYDALDYDLLFALLPLAIAAIALCISMYQPVRFLRMVRNQEAMFGVAFGEKKFAPLYPRTPYHASPDWFICMGSWAFYRGYIDKLTHQTRGRGTPAISYYAKVRTTDGKNYCFRMESASDQKHFYAWWKAGRK